MLDAKNETSSSNVRIVAEKILDNVDIKNPNLDTMHSKLSGNRQIQF